MKINLFRLIFNAIQLSINFIDNIIASIPCKLGYHDFQVVPPEIFNIHYEKLECTCGIIFRGMNHIKNHLRFGAPACTFDRVCMKCSRVEFRLEAETLKAIEEMKKEEIEETRLVRAKRILKEYETKEN